MGMPSADELFALKSLSNPTTVAVGSASTASSALGKGVYEITCDVDCFWLQGASGVTATTSSHPLWAKERRLIYTEGVAGDSYIAVIRSSSDGTLYIEKRENG